jgi:phosphoribosyl 1,2-cyclic phosphodiesterase
VELRILMSAASHLDTSKVALEVTFWGTRGSIPSPGASTVRFGGNTPCVEVRGANGQRCILDAGTGIRALGLALLEDGALVDTDLFLTHFHWDHIQGLPFFAPGHARNARIRVHAPAQERAPAVELLAAQMTAPHFPVPFSDLHGVERVVEHDVGEWTAGSFVFRATRTCHPSRTFGYRIQSGGVALVYIPDNEISLLRDRGGETAYDELVAFCSEADLLVHDAMYTSSEYPDKVGWGHSTYLQAATLAVDAGVGRLRLFHHAPERTDAELERIVSELREHLRTRRVTLDIAAAAEGERISLSPGSLMDQ